MFQVTNVIFHKMIQKNNADRCFHLLFPGSENPLLQRCVFKIPASDWLVLFTMTKVFFKVNCEKNLKIITKFQENQKNPEKNGLKWRTTQT